MSADRQSAAHVLVVDDEPHILELLELALVRMGLQVERATTVQEALQQLRDKPFDLCLTDMRLPDGEGLKVVQFIAENNMDVPVAVPPSRRWCCGVGRRPRC